MRSAEPVRVGVPAWAIAVPLRPGRLAGATMAGFSDRADSLVDVEVVPHPAVMIIFDLGDRALLVDDGNGQQQRGRVVAGLAPDRAPQWRWTAATPTSPTCIVMSGPSPG